MQAIGHGRRACGCAIIVALAWGAPWAARAATPRNTSSPVATPAAESRTPASSTHADSFKHDATPYSVSTIAHMLAEAPAHDVLRLNYNVIVGGRTPPPELFKNFNLTEGPVPFGAPTAEQFHNLTTPDAFKTPAIPFAPLVDWFITKITHH